MNSNEEMHADNADPDATWFEYRLCWYWFMYHNYVSVPYNNIKMLECTFLWRIQFLKIQRPSIYSLGAF